jgi:hypothetical protein
MKTKIGWAILTGTALLLLWRTLPGRAMVGAGGPVGFQGQAPVGFEGRSTFQGHPDFQGRHDFRGHSGFQSWRIIALGVRGNPGYPESADSPPAVQGYVRPRTDAKQSGFWYYCQGSHTTPTQRSARADGPG